MKRSDENESPRNKRKSIKLIDFATPEKEDEDINSQQPDSLMFPKQSHPQQDPFYLVEIQQQLVETEKELNSLKTIYDEQQLIVNTYRQKEQSTNELISNMKKDMIALEANLADLQATLSSQSESHKLEIESLNNKHNVHIKALTDMTALLNNSVTRLESKASLAESQCKEATNICNELMLHFQNDSKVHKNEDLSDLL